MRELKSAFLFPLQEEGTRHERGFLILNTDELVRRVVFLLEELAQVFLQVHVWRGHAQGANVLQGGSCVQHVLVLDANSIASFLFFLVTRLLI